SHRLIEVHAISDPAPAVRLELPSRSQDSLDLLADAELTIQVQAEDPLFAIRSAYLEYRMKRSNTAIDELSIGRLPLYHHEAIEKMGPQLLAALGASPVPIPAPSWRLGPQRLEIARRWSLRDLKLKEGDLLTLQACADDFDDVTVGKKPGRSQEV